jgi:hypothetical protein
MAKKPQYTELVSPIGIANWAFVTKPAEPYTKGDDPEYKITVGLEDTDENRAWCNKFIETAQSDAKKHGVKLKKAGKIPFNYPEDQDEDDFKPKPEGTGKYPETFKDRIIFQTKSKFRPGVIDTKRQDLPEDVRIMSGDEVRVKVAVNPYEGMGSGISMRLKVVQLVQKNTSFSGRKPNLDGFDDVDGYVADSSDGDEDENF